MKTKIFSLFLMLVISIGTMFASVSIDGIAYNLDETNFTAEVTSLPSGNYTGSVTIPASVTYKDVPYGVKSIGDGAFQNCKSLLSVTIPNSVTRIGNNAFYSCTSLTSIEIPNSVTNIGSYSFFWCRGLASIKIPNSVTSIGDRAFYGCTGLTSPVYNAHVFAYMPISYSGAYTILDGIEFIVDYAFSECTDLTSIEIPNSVTNIGDYAFYKCFGLTSVEIPNSVKIIGDYAFQNCKSVLSVTIGNSVTSIGYYAFHSCSSLSSVTIGNSVTSIGNYAFDHCVNLLSITIPNTVTSIGDHAFDNCSKVTSITIPNSVTSIGESAFYGCTGLTSVEIPNTISIVEAQTFYRCTSLTSIIIPNSVTSIGHEAFRYCSSLDSVIIDNGVTDISKNAFSDCTSLIYIMLGNRVANIENEAFLNCYSLKSITFPSSIKSIGYIVFRGCRKLESVHISDIASWCSIDFKDGLLDHVYNLYLNNDLITDLVIPDSIRSIGHTAFNYCLLNSVSIEAFVPPIIGSGTFSNSDYPIYVPCNTLDIYKSANIWSNYAERIQYRLLDYKMTIIPSEHGQVNTPIFECEQLVATPDYGYHFVQWNDGNTENPRTIILIQDTTFTAEFAVDKSGFCGKDSALNWSYEDKSKTLTITGEGELTENYTFGIEAPVQMKTLIIGNDVTSIGDSAFYGMTTINHLTIGGNVASIGNYAFAECKNFDDITCHAQTVPTINATTFANVGNKQYIYLYVPEDRERAYKRDTWWGQFDVQIQKAETTTTDGDVKVTPTDNTAEITWPAVNGAETYDIEITKEGEVICVLTFNANGQLVGIAFAPSRPNTNHAQQAQTAGFKFTITGLTGNTTYNYAVASKDNTGNTIDTKSGSFTTTGGEQGLEDSVIETQKAHKLLRDGQILILRGEKVYTLQGQEVK